MLVVLVVSQVCVCVYCVMVVWGVVVGLVFVGVLVGVCVWVLWLWL